MKLTVLQENLAKTLQVASRFTSTRAQLPVLGNILFSAGKAKLKIGSTNLETSVTISLGAQVTEEGEITVPAKTITEIVSNLSSGPLEIVSEKEHLKISAQNFTSKVLGMNTADFPKIPQVVPSNDTFLLPREKLGRALSQVMFAASSDESRPILTGILFLFSKSNLTLVATDGFRLSRKTVALTGVTAGESPFRVVLPKNPLMEISHFEESVEEIKLALKTKENQAIFGIGEIVLSSRVLEGEFPDFEKIIPKTSTVKVRADKEDFLRAVKLASVFARDSANIVKVKVGKDIMELSAESSQAGEQKTNVEVKSEGEIPFEIAFNYRFLEEAIKAVNGEEIQMSFTNSNAPGVFTDPKDTEFLHLIMPVKVQV